MRRISRLYPVWLAVLITLVFTASAQAQAGQDSPAHRISITVGLYLSTDEAVPASVQLDLLHRLVREHQPDNGVMSAALESDLQEGEHVVWLTATANPYAARAGGQALDRDQLVVWTAEQLSRWFTALADLARTRQVAEAETALLPAMRRSSALLADRTSIAQHLAELTASLEDEANEQAAIARQLRAWTAAMEAVEGDITQHTLELDRLQAYLEQLQNTPLNHDLFASYKPRFIRTVAQSARVFAAMD